MAEAAQVTLRGGAVRLTLPARVANDLDALQVSLSRLAERLGHPNCATGCDTLFLQLERLYAANASGELNPQPLPPAGGPFLPQDPIPISQVNVSVPKRVLGDIESLQKAAAITLERLGCGKCCSGFDIAFRRELDLIAFNENLESQGFGRFR